MDQNRGWMVLVGAMLALCGCGQQPGDPALLARVGEVSIVADDLQRLVDRLASNAEAASGSEVSYWGQLQTLVDREVLLLEARARALEGDSLVLERLLLHEEDVLVREMLYRQVTARLAITPEEVEGEYERGGWEEETKSMEIFVSDESRAQIVLDGLAAGSDFGELGRLYSEDRLFKIPVGSPQVSTYAPKDAPRRVAEAVTGLPEGEIVGPIAVSGGYVFAKVLGRRKVQLDEVRQRVVKWLTRTKKEALRDVYYISLQKSFGLELNQDGMDLVVRSLEEGRPAEGLAAGEQRLAVYTYRGGALDVEKALASVARKASRWPSIDESLVVEELRKELRRRLVVLDARSQGVDQAESFRRWVRGRQEDLMISRLRSLVLEDELEITEEDIRSRYEEIKERLDRPGIARVLDLLVEDPDLARALRQEIETGVDMRGLIGQHSIRQNAKEGVLQVHDIETRLYGEAWLKAVMSAPLEELQGPIKTKGGFSLFKVLEREEAGYYTLENPQIRKTVNRDVKAAKERTLFNDFLKRLQRKYAEQIEVFEGNLARWEAQREELESAPPSTGSPGEVGVGEGGGHGAAP